METKNILVVLFAVIALNSQAQTDDFALYLSQAWACVNSGNCDAAEKNYSVYKDLTGSSNSALEEAITKCKEGSSSKPIAIGEELGNGWRLGYLDSSGRHGFMINELGEYDCIVPDAFPEVSITELKSMYNDRYALKLRGEYWSTTKVEGTSKCYTFDFSTGKVNERKRCGKQKYKYLYIRRF